MLNSSCVVKNNRLVDQDGKTKCSSQDLLNINRSGADGGSQVNPGNLGQEPRAEAERKTTQCSKTKPESK